MSSVASIAEKTSNTLVSSIPFPTKDAASKNASGPRHKSAVMKKAHRRLKSSKPVLGRPKGITVEIARGPRNKHTLLSEVASSAHRESTIGKPSDFTRPGSSPHATNKTTRATTKHLNNVSQYPELKALSMPRILSEVTETENPHGSLVFSARKSDQEDVVHGVGNTHNLDYIQNVEKLKTNLLQSYMLQGVSLRDLSKNEKLKHAHDINRCLESREVPIEHTDPAPAWKKSIFCPFKQERDHLGRILDSVSTQP